MDQTQSALIVFQTMINFVKLSSMRVLRLIAKKSKLSVKESIRQIKNVRIVSFLQNIATRLIINAHSIDHSQRVAATSAFHLLSCYKDSLTDILTMYHL